VKLILKIARENPEYGYDRIQGVLKNLNIHDRDSKFSEAFCNSLNKFGIEPLKLPTKSPNLNTLAGKMFLSILSRMTFLTIRGAKAPCYFPFSNTPTRFTIYHLPFKIF